MGDVRPVLMTKHLGGSEEAGCLLRSSFRFAIAWVSSISWLLTRICLPT